MKTYQVNFDRKYPCISMDTDGDLYVEQSDDTTYDVYLRLSPEDKLTLASDLVRAAIIEIQEADDDR